MARRLRENKEEWSRWVQAIVPDRHLRGRYERRRRGQEGVMYKKIRRVLHNEMNKCGIYEWQARGFFIGQPNAVVVYVGSTCRANPGSLRDRILEYCKNGAHKSAIINKALQRGYELWVRVKTSGPSSHRSREAPGNMENELLKRYDYAWNLQNNGKTSIREILPDKPGQYRDT